MAITDGYAVYTDYKTAFGITVSTQDTRIQSVLLAVSRYVDRRCHRFFGVDAAVVERLYDPYDRVVRLDDRPAFVVDDISTATGLVVKLDEDLDGSVADETAWTIDTDFTLWPQNANLGPEAQPWRAIRLPTWSSKSFLATARLSVTAKFGWPAVPAVVAQATLELAGIVMTDSPRATTRIQEGVEAVIGASPQAQSIVMSLVHHYGRRAAL